MKSVFLLILALEVIYGLVTSLGAVKKGTAKRSRINQTTLLVRTRSNVILQPSRLEYYHYQSVKQLVRTRTDIKLWPGKCSITHAFSLYLAIAI